jgi:hypothetical protein
MTEICKRGDVVVIERKLVTYFNASMGRAPESRTEYTLGHAASVKRNGLVQEVRLRNFPYDPASKHQSHQVKHMQATRVFTVLGDKQALARRLANNTAPDRVWYDTETLKASMLANDAAMVTP